MTLTPEDVISKTFQATRFAEGYNQDEVDDFLDEVVSTLRALTNQIDDLETKLKTSDAEVTKLKSQPAPEPARLLKEEPAPEPTPAPVAAPVVGGEPGNEAAGAAGMLVLAQRLHDEHVRNGQQQRDALVSEARVRADKLVSEAEETRANTLSTLELERDQLQSFIDGLRVHEREYRTRMRSFFQAQLADLENQQSLEPDAAAI